MIISVRYGFRLDTDKYHYKNVLLENFIELHDKIKFCTKKTAEYSLDTLVLQKINAFSSCVKTVCVISSVYRKRNQVV